jgi:hypothetical protein
LGLSRRQLFKVNRNFHRSGAVSFDPGSVGKPWLPKEKTVPRKKAGDGWRKVVEELKKI